MWGVWREWHTIDELGKHHAHGEWVTETTHNGTAVFNRPTEREAQAAAGVWKATSPGWVYTARKVD